MKKKPVKNYQLPDALKEIRGFAPGGGGSDCNCGSNGSTSCNCSDSGNIYCSCTSSSLQINNCSPVDNDSHAYCASAYTTAVWDGCNHITGIF